MNPYPTRPTVPDDDPRYESPKRCGHWGNRRSDKSLCLGWCIGGTHHCKTHAGKRTDIAIAEGRVALEYSDAAKHGLPAKYNITVNGLIPNVDPGDTLLRLLTQAWWRANHYAEELARIIGEHDSLAEALTGDTYAVTEDGSVVKTGEYIRAMTELEASERDRCFTYATKAVAAGLAERQVVVLERQVDILERALTDTLAEMGLTQDQQDDAIVRLDRHLRIAA